MALVQAVGSGCEVILEKFDLETACDVLTAASDKEVLDFIQQQEEEVQMAWSFMVDWAKLRSEEQLERIYQEGFFPAPALLRKPLWPLRLPSTPEW